eukprot:TRINITY_DN7713_c0_g1_i1.p1 TRINITY_DN7713_c0_g1~~TRINITY_DN7713_c0_g1_i1.p1  ORF type:complete len:363 (-),score=98.41 TRINITY_DN7713_c0_g1_i1:137-1225(-)
MSSEGHPEGSEENILEDLLQPGDMFEEEEVVKPPPQHPPSGSRSSLPSSKALINPEDHSDISESSSSSDHSSSSSSSSPQRGCSPPPKHVSPPPPKKRPGKSYDYATKLNYLFRDARFFVVKSNNLENIALSKTKGVWSTPPANETRFNTAFAESRNVLLLYSVKESGRFTGFARLSAQSRRDGAPVAWVLPPGLSARALGGVFKIDWICRKELSFTRVSHLFNPWNEGKPVKIGRDGQEIEPRVAEELCRLFPPDDSVDMTPILRKSKAAAREHRMRPKEPVVSPRRRRVEENFDTRTNIESHYSSRYKDQHIPRRRAELEPYHRRRHADDHHNRRRAYDRSVDDFLRRTSKETRSYYPRR